MYLDSRDGIEGQIAFLTSPLFTSKPNYCLQFKVSLKVSQLSESDRLIVRLVNDETPYSMPVPLYERMTPTSQDSSWESISIRLPASGTYKALFGFVAGFPYYCMAAIDHILVGMCPDNAIDGIPMPGW